jgi:hypothetical protein
MILAYNDLRIFRKYVSGFFYSVGWGSVPKFSANLTLLLTAYEAGQFDDKPFETTEEGLEWIRPHR